MNPPPPEKSNKKVSRACNTCRLKRKKCDGREPCYFCTETKVECSYSREPRRRGPPSGYLRYTETRVTLFETLLGLFLISASSHFSLSISVTQQMVSSALLSAMKTLRSESATCTQEVWDAYKIQWTSSEAAEVLEELANHFSPFSHRLDENGIGEFAKPLLPPGPNSGNGGGKGVQQNVKEQHTPSPAPEALSPTMRRTVTLSVPSTTPISIHPHDPHTEPFSPAMMPRESFERTQTSDSHVQHPPQFARRPDTVGGSSSGAEGLYVFPARQISQDSELEDASPLDPPSTGPSTSTQLAYSPKAKAQSQEQFRKDDSLMGIGGTSALEDVQMSEISMMDDPLAGGVGPLEYTGSYWRTAELALSEVSLSPGANPFQPLPSSSPWFTHPSISSSSTPATNHNSYSDPSFPFSTHALDSSSLSAQNHDNVPASSNSSNNLFTNLFAPTSFSLPNTGVNNVTEDLDLPPPHILTNLLDIYYTHVHPSFPFLAPRASIDALLATAAENAKALAGTALGSMLGNTGLSGLGESTTCLLLALCAYAGRLSPGVPGVETMAGSHSLATGMGLGTSAFGAFMGAGVGSSADPSSNLGLGVTGGGLNGLNGFGFGGGGDASKIASDLWYEQARGALNGLLRRQGRLETVQTLLLFALRDHGKGAEGQAWLLVGMAIRVGQEIDLPASATPATSASLQSSRVYARFTPEEHAVRANVWGVAVMLDLLLSLQLGKPPAVADALKLKAPSVSSATSGLIAANGVKEDAASKASDINMETKLVDSTIKNPSIFSLSITNNAASSLFAYSLALSHIVSRINLYLYQGFGPSSTTKLAANANASSLSGTPSDIAPSPSVSPAISSTPSDAVSGSSALVLSSPKSAQDKLWLLKNELESWHQALPMQFRVSIGSSQPGKEVLEINMFYHVAMILLYRPFARDNVVHGAMDIFLDAASTFNVLLEKYKNQYYTPPAASSSTSGVTNPFTLSVPSITLSNPNMIYLIFTVAIAHLNGHRYRKQQFQQKQLGATDPTHPRGISPHPMHNPHRNISPHHGATSHISPHVRPQAYQHHLHAHAPSPATTLQTQLHLLNCLDALKAIGGTWELARRCWRTLDRLMDMEGMKPGGHGGARESVATAEGDADVDRSSRKRKRESDSEVEALSGSGTQQKGRARAPSSASNVDAGSSSGASTFRGTSAESPEGTSVGGPFTPSDTTGTTLQGAGVGSEGTAMMDWHKTPASIRVGVPSGFGSGGTTMSHTSPMSLPPDFFDQTIFSSGWLGEFPELENGAGAGGGFGGGLATSSSWDPDWDDKSWGKLGSGLDGG